MKQWQWTGCFLLMAALTGCGTTKSQTATDQLLMSDAVDRAVASIDFRPLAGKTVYLDTQFARAIKGIGFVNAEYITSAVRQQMVAANCLLQDAKEQAEYIVEMRVGALGTDSHNVTYGVPPSNILNTAASLVPNAPPIPIVPELSLAKRDDKQGAAKIAVFAYHRETREPLWQSGLAQARSNSKDVWLLGAGPFQSGTIYDGTHFAGNEVRFTLGKGEDGLAGKVSTYSREVHYGVEPEPVEAEVDSEVVVAGYEEQAEPGGAAAEPKAGEATQPAEKPAGNSAEKPAAPKSP